MPKKINVKGPIIRSSSKWIYELFGIEAVCSKDVEDAITEANGDELEVNINSGGGDVYAGSEIYTLLQQYSGNVIGNILGVAASAASVVGMGCKVLRIAPTAQIMIHNTSSYAEGDHQAMKKQADVLHGWDKSICNAYRLKTGMSEEALLNLMNRTTWMTAQEALQYKFVDEIMFDEGHKLAAAENMSGMIPEQVINTMRDLVTQHGITPVKDNYDKIKQLFNLSQKGVKSMGLQEIMAKLSVEEQATVTADIQLQIETAKAEAITAVQASYAGELKQLQDTIESLKAQIPAPPEPTDEEMLASLDPKVRDMVLNARAAEQKAKDSEAQAAAELARVKDEQELARIKAEIGSLDKLPINADEFGPIFKNFENVDAEGYSKLKALLVAANNMAADSQVFNSIGTSKGGQTPVEDTEGRIEQLVKAEMEDKKVDRPTALQNVLRQNPDLYDAYRTGFVAENEMVVDSENNE